MTHQSSSPDIVERLNEHCVGHPYAKIEWPHRLLHDARDEIERLRTALSTAEKVIYDLTDGITGTTQRDEAERLRCSADIATEMLWKMIRFYDAIDRDHANGEAKLLDEAAAVVAAAQTRTLAQPTPVSLEQSAVETELFFLFTSFMDDGETVSSPEGK